MTDSYYQFDLCDQVIASKYGIHVADFLTNQITELMNPKR